MKEPTLYPMEFTMIVGFSEYPDDLHDGTHDDAEIMDNHKLRGKAEFRWEPGCSTIDSKYESFY